MTLVIVLMAAIAVALVKIRRSEVTVRHEIQRLETHQITLRRRFWDQQILYGRVMAPAEVRRRAEEIAPELGDGTR